VNNTSNSLLGKTALVTGATNGIGKAAAIALAEMGAEVVLIARNRALAQQTVDEIKRDTANQKIDFLVADLSSQAEVRRVADEFLASGRPLHILLNNAGALFTQRQLSADGIEMTFALNHLGYFLLTDLLLDRIKQSAPARIVNVASRAHEDARGGINFDDLQFAQKYSPFASYSQSKLANILFTRELASRLAGTQVTVNCLHPGFVATRFGHGSKMMGLIMSLLRPFQRSIDKGARTSIYLCSSPEVENISGEYFADSKITQPSPFAKDDAAAKRLWEISEEVTLSR
jgi:NAD(P)-dependent dehydrogenase (short-subunit alcohol dehydrogenase family)